MHYINCHITIPSRSWFLNRTDPRAAADPAKLDRHGHDMPAGSWQWGLEDRPSGWIGLLRRIMMANHRSWQNIELYHGKIVPRQVQ
jgi:hypothetical protein